MLWSKWAKSGRSWTRVQASGVPVAKLWRTGASSLAWVQSCEWQLMQVYVGG